jgi:hypothetical protein
MAFLSKPNNAWVAYLRLRMVKKQSNLAHELRDEIGAHFSAISKGAEAVLVLRASR